MLTPSHTHMLTGLLVPSVVLSKSPLLIDASTLNAHLRPGDLAHCHVPLHTNVQSTTYPRVRANQMQVDQHPLYDHRPLKVNLPRLRIVRLPLPRRYLRPRPRRNLHHQKSFSQSLAAILTPPSHSPTPPAQYQFFVKVKGQTKRLFVRVPLPQW